MSVSREASVPAALEAWGGKLRVPPWSGACTGVLTASRSARMARGCEREGDRAPGSSLWESCPASVRSVSPSVPRSSRGP